MARITVVDDHPDFLELMEIILGQGGHEVSGFTGDVSLDDLAASEPDLLILDLVLTSSGVDGGRLLYEIRSEPRFTAIPVLVCTADIKTARDRRQELRSLGDVEVIEKPFEVAEVEEVVRRKLELRATQVAASPSSQEWCPSPGA